MNAMKYREMYFTLYKEVQKTITQLERALWETEKRLAEIPGITTPDRQEKQGGN